MIEISDIIVAIENKEHFVLDDFIKQGEFCKASNGQLQRFVGGFTAVFPVIVNQEKWAFRCWHAEMGNVRRRFEKIADAISTSGAKYLCDFAYADEGIIVKGKRYPTTHMRWVEGQTIKDYICANANDAHKLNSLAKRFLLMVQDMHKHGFAHGDLQHGNIIIDKHGEPFLVDYDSFYCPALKGESDIITGLADYQHPARKQCLIANEKLDYFSELIIYTSILAIAENPQLVSKYKVHDSERMLFAASDYADIKHSGIYADLCLLSPIIQQLLDILSLYLTKNSINDLQPFDVVLDIMTKEPKIKRFGCSNQICLKGDKVIFSWDVQNFTQLLFDGQDVTAQSKIEITANTQTDYKLEVVNYQKRVSQSLRLKILPRPQVAFSASKNKLHANKNEQVELKWDVQHAESCSLVYADHTDDCRKSGTMVLTPEETATYILRVLALDKRTTVGTPITVAVFPDARVQFSADKEYVFPSIPFTLSWQVQHAKKVELNGKVVKYTDSKTYPDGIDKNTTYTLRVTDEFGTKEYPLTIKQLPIPQIKTILVPTPKISEKINVNINIPDFKIVETPNLKVKSFKQNYLYLSSRKNSLIGRITFDKILTTIKNKISI